MSILFGGKNSGVEKRRITRAVKKLSDVEAEAILCSYYLQKEFFHKNNLFGCKHTHFHRHLRWKICDKLGIKRPGQKKGDKDEG